MWSPVYIDIALLKYDYMPQHVIARYCSLIDPLILHLRRRFFQRHSCAASLVNMHAVYLARFAVQTNLTMPTMTQSSKDKSVA